MRAASAFFCGAVVLAKCAIAGDAQGNFAVRGIGQAACSGVNEAAEAETPVFHQFGGYLSGFITGLNLERQGTFDLVLFEDTDTLMLYVLRACRETPQRPFIEVVRELVSAIEDSRVTAFIGYETVGSEQQTTVYRQTYVKSIQELVSLGYLAEGTNLGAGELTRAIEAFQADRDLPSSGTLDQQTLVQLLRASGDQK